MSDGLRIRRLRIYVALLLALGLTLLVAVIIPDFFPKYHAPLVESGFIDKPGGNEYYEDLDGDGFSERIILFNNTLQEASVKIIEENGAIGAHYYLKGQVLRHKTSCAFCDYDSSGYQRIFLFTATRDSLLLHCIDPVKKRDFEYRDRFVASLNQRNGVHDFQVDVPRFADLTGDGKQEMITTVMAGFPLKPRIGIIFDPAGDTLIRSRDQGTFFFVNAIRDINNDGIPELLTMNYSIGNYPDSCREGTGDHKAGILVFDRYFNPLFQPVMYTGRYLHAFTLPICDKQGNSRLITLLASNDTLASPGRLILSDSSGRQLKERILPWSPTTPHLSLLKFDEYPDLVAISDHHGSILLFDAALDSVQSFELHDSFAGYMISMDADQDGLAEHLFQAGSLRTPVILRAGFKDPVTLQFPVGAEQLRAGLKRYGAQPPWVFIQQADNYYLFSYGRNPYYWLKIPFYLGIFAGFFGLILFSQYLQRIFLRQQYEAEKKIAGLQLLLLKNQLDPHFTFNAINAVTSLLMQSRNEEANQKLISLSKLMRSGVEHADRLSRPLGEELSFVNNYIDLVRHRLNEDFRYTISVAPEVDLSWQVPRMITQIYVENAIKHGLIPLETDGRLDLRVFKDEGSLVIEIEDNGIGRQRAAVNGTGGTGRGMAVMDQFYALFNRFNKEKLTCTITDLYRDDRQPAGTLVRIRIPQGFRSENYF